MDFCIKVEKALENQIIIESPAELGEQVLSLLLKEGYTLTEFLSEAIGRSANSGFVLKNPDMKYYSLMILAQKKEADISDIANCIHGNFGGYLSLPWRKLFNII
ncbi:hypothetical protein [Peribacillus deserti]|uniref:Uncharacterized protein n=1 Tax=Peribacillus deserti TaxID=673318 RepID=A0A2N5M4J9_9BACI|nr:hypothetical protein [Peribacillus deserti]PLT29289.1 hypothetical protein CUU66_14080 [Peribacillus deserti]